MKSFLIAAAIAALPMTASAVTLSPTPADIAADSSYSFGLTMTSGDGNADFTFEATEDLTISSFGVSGSGTNSGVDLDTVTYGTSEPTTTSFLTFVSGTASSGFGFLGGVTLLAGETVTVYFDSVIVNPVSVTVSFSTTESSVPPPSVPLPAAGLLLGSVLVGGGLMSRKKKA